MTAAIAPSVGLKFLAILVPRLHFGGPLEITSSLKSRFAEFSPPSLFPVGEGCPNGTEEGPGLSVGIGRCASEDRGLLRLGVATPHPYAQERQPRRHALKPVVGSHAILTPPAGRGMISFVILRPNLT